jgi:DNA repair protein RadC
MTKRTKTTLSIRAWAEDDQPRYKLLHKGRQSLSDSELLAILIGSGSTDLSAVDLCKMILASVERDLEALSRLSLADLMKFKGIGEAKAVTIAAALELGRRRQLTDIRQKPQIRDSASAWEAIAPLLIDKNHEEFWVMYLNRSNQIINRNCVSMGGVAGTYVDPKVVFSKAVELLASAIILCHNHPSGQLKPSQEDIRLTKKLQEAGKVLDITVMDHLIIAGQQYFSFADEGLM